MVPVVILDTNALHGRKSLSSTNSKLIQALSKSGQIRLILPGVVLHELSRQRAEESEDYGSKLSGALSVLNETLAALGEETIDVPLPVLDRARFHDDAKRRLEEKCVEIPAPPNIHVERLLEKDLDIQKPFDREGKGFRDALIWETIRALCDGLEHSDNPVVLVTNNYTDFCTKKGGTLHPDLQQDLAKGREVEVVPSLYDLLEHELIRPLVDSHRQIKSQLRRDCLVELIDLPVSELYGRDVEDAVGIYTGSGMYDVPVSTGLEGATFDDVMPILETLDYEIFRDGDGSKIRVNFDAECSFDGFMDKSTFYINEGDDYTLFEDWNDHVFRVGSSGLVHFVFSGSFVGTSLDNLILTLEEAEDVLE